MATLRALEQIILARLDVGQLHLALALERLFGKSRIQQNVSEQIQADGKITAQHLCIRPETLVAAIRIDAPATDSISRAMSSALRRFVPLNQRFAIN